MASPLSWGWLKYDDWHWPSWTIGGTFGIDAKTLAPDLLGVQQIIAAVTPHSPGWVFLALGSILTFAGSVQSK